MSTFIKKQSLSEKRKAQPWDLRKVIETYSDKTYKQVVKEQKKK